MPQPLEVVAHLLLLGSQLVGIVQGLPAAAPAGAEVGALRLDAFVGVVLDIHCAAFGEVFLFLYYFNVGDVTRHYIGDEDYHAVDPCYCLAFGTDVGDKDVFEDGLFLFLLHGLLLMPGWCGRAGRGWVG